MIDLTDSAISHFTKQLGPAGLLKITLKRYGCSGYAYDCSVVDSAPEGYSEINIKGVRVIFDPSDQARLKGLLIDFQRRGLNSRVIYINPNEISRCGCGESSYFG